MKLSPERKEINPPFLDKSISTCPYLSHWFLLLVMD